MDRSGQTVDDPVLARFSPEHAELSLHAGPEIVRQTVSLLRECGFADEPEAADLRSRVHRLLPLCRTELATRTLLAQLGNADRPVKQTSALKHLLFPPTVALIGLPNVGKSTLLNRLAGTEAAITADLPGTTRDYVSAEADLGGLIVRLLDTPGQRSTADPIESQAITNARSAIAAADCRILVLDATHPADHPTLEADLLVWNKCDQASPPSPTTPPTTRLPRPTPIALSATTGQGLADLRTALLGHFGITPDLPEHHLPLP
jgi:small GTP-binding protein